jgi:hypothetical protein
MAKIDLSKLKVMAKGLGVLRPYTSLLWPGVIVFAGMLVLAAALLMGSSLKRKINRESIPMASQVKSLLGSAPALKQAEMEKRYEDAYQRDANLISRLSMETTQRELLDYSIFPQPRDTSAMLFTRFGNTYRRQIEKLIENVNGRDCPSEEELKVSMQRASVGRGGLPTIGMSSEESKVIDEICQARAKATSVYVNAADISGYDFWEQYEYSNLDQGVKDCWFWQLGYWIIKDVFSTVESMNAGSGNVNSSPVKRIMGVGFVSPDKLIVTGRKSQVPQDEPKYVIKPGDQLTESFTGLMSNDTIDVVQFSVVVVVDADAVIPFMEKLCSEKEHQFTGYTGEEPAKSFKHNQISILESNVKIIRPESAGHQYYRYGNQPAAEVELVCEYIFNKKGYGPIYPEALKEKPSNVPSDE